jgi:putative phosphoribosyl transferase
MHENERLIEIPAGTAELEAILGLPDNARGVVLFAHGSGSGRLSPRNNFVARRLRDAGLGTLLMDLLTVEEAEDRSKVLNIDLLAHRILLATDWLEENGETKHLRVGYFAVGAGAGAALAAAAQVTRDGVLPITGEPGPCAVVSRGGLPDLAGPALADVKAPTLLIVGGNDEPLIGLNKKAYAELRCEKQMVVVPGATHLFEEQGALEEVARLAADWFLRHLKQECEKEL